MKMKKNQATVFWVLGLGTVVALGTMLYSSMNQGSDMGETTTPVGTVGNGKGQAGGFDSYVTPAVDYTGGLLPWLQKQLNPMPTPDFGVNASPYYGSTTPPSTDIGVHYGVGGTTSQPWTPSGSTSSGGFGVNLGPH